MALRWQSTPMRRSLHDIIADFTGSDKQRAGRFRIKKTSGLLQLELLFNGDIIKTDGMNGQERLKQFAEEFAYGKSSEVGENP